MKKIYIVRYSKCDYPEYFVKDIFVTESKIKALEYCNKFNRIVKKWKNYYKKFEKKEFGTTWLKDEYIEQHYNRWYSLRDIVRCYFEKIEIR